MKKSLMVLLVVLAALTAVGVVAAEDDVFRVAMVMPSKINDYSFSQSMYEALVKLGESYPEGKFELVRSEDMFDVANAREAIRDYADMGYDLVIAHGSQYGTSLQEIAPDYPETAFAWGNGTDFYGQPNITAYQARAEQGGYVLGEVAPLHDGPPELAKQFDRYRNIPAHRPMTENLVFHDIHGKYHIIPVWGFYPTTGSRQAGPKIFVRSVLKSHAAHQSPAYPGYLCRV